MFILSRWRKRGRACQLGDRGRSKNIRFNKIKFGIKLFYPPEKKFMKEMETIAIFSIYCAVINNYFFAAKFD